MRRSNFKPKEYEKLGNVRKKIISYLNDFGVLSNKKVLDIGCGTGLFSYEIAKANRKSFVHGIDIVNEYIYWAHLNNKYLNAKFNNISYDKIKGKYDIITMFLSFTELLKYKSIDEILKHMSNLLTDDGYIVLCDEFSNDYTLDKDILGLEIMKSIGYKYLNTGEFIIGIASSDFNVLETRTFRCGTQTTNLNGSKVKIFYENKLNEYDNTKKIESDFIWQKYKNDIIKTKGFRSNNLIRMYILKKSDFKKSHILALRNDKPMLVYDITKINENIDYYEDLKKEFQINYLFPVKAFPHKKILEIFTRKSFGFDVSNQNELKLVKNSKNSFIMFSDPTSGLQNKNGIRINVYGKYIKSHFGNEYDYKSNYEIIHLHVAELKTKSVLEEILKAIKRIDYSSIKTLNIGGGYDNLTYQELREFITNIKKIIPSDVALILEPGSIWFKDSGYLFARIKKIVQLRDINFLYLNASKELHAKWSIPKLYYIESKNGNKNSDYVFCGNTCYEKDIFCTLKSQNDLKENAKVIFSNIEPYSYSWNTSFNGVEPAEVYFYE